MKHGVLNIFTIIKLNASNFSSFLLNSVTLIFDLIFKGELFLIPLKTLQSFSLVFSFFLYLLIYLLTYNLLFSYSLSHTKKDRRCNKIRWRGQPTIRINLGEKPMGKMCNLIWRGLFLIMGSFSEQGVLFIISRSMLLFFISHYFSQDESFQLWILGVTDPLSLLTSSL